MFNAFVSSIEHTKFSTPLFPKLLLTRSSIVRLQLTSLSASLRCANPFFSILFSILFSARFNDIVTLQLHRSSVLLLRLLQRSRSGARLRVLQFTSLYVSCRYAVPLFSFYS